MKKNMIKIMTVVMAIAMVFGMTACNGNDANKIPGTEETKPTAVVTESVTVEPTETEKEHEISVVTSEPEVTPEPTKEPEVTAEPTGAPELETSATDDIINMLKNGEITTMDQFKEVVVPDVVRVCNNKATCETDVKACVIDLNSNNPYDVTWDFGEDYNKYVELIDWKTGAHAFIAADYEAEYPMLALQYNNDAELLFRHFVTVGIHEGRKANKEYATVDILDVCNILNSYDYNDDNINGYFAAKCIIWRLLEYCNIDTGASDAGITKVSNKYVVEYPMLTKIQRTELERINEYRKDAGVAEVKFNTELAALANFRARYNAENGLEDHSWAIQNDAKVDEYSKTICENYSCYAENTTSKVNANTNFAQHYKNSPEHYETMVNGRYELTGVSNVYNSNLMSSQFDLYLDTQ